MTNDISSEAMKMLRLVHEHHWLISMPKVDKNGKRYRHGEVGLSQGIMDQVAKLLEAHGEKAKSD